MRRTVLVFGPQAVAVGTRSIEIDLVDSPCTVADVLEAIGAASPALLPSLAASRLAVDHEFATPERLLTGGEELALIGMVSGG
ncbi:MAG: MoaD/ThiS family protein [Lacipirellulaceae bacterium]